MNNLFINGMGIFVLFIIIIYWLAVPFFGRWIAIEKGYSPTIWFWLCFFFNAFALITICGAPNKYSEQLLNEINQNTIKPKNLSSIDNNSSNPVPVVKRINGDSWICKKCDEVNSANSSSCKGCGEYR